jgi:hypothetical protein
MGATVDSHRLLGVEIAADRDRKFWPPQLPAQ